MSQKMLRDDIKAGVVRILAKDGKTQGTGFVISRSGEETQGSGILILTCAHVVEDAGGAAGSQVDVIFHGASSPARVSALVVENLFRPPPEDIAVLRFDGKLPDGVRPLSLCAWASDETKKYFTFGFPNTGTDGLWASCELLGSTAASGHKIVQLRSAELTNGFSGAPLCDDERQCVIGMVNSILPPDKMGRLATTSFVTPSSSLSDVCPAAAFDAHCPPAHLDPSPEDRLRPELISWTKKNSESYPITGTEVRLPIEGAVFRLRLQENSTNQEKSTRQESLREWLDAYHEWDELAKYSRRDAFGPLSLYFHGRRFVVIAGPGSGKSTLCRFLAYHRSSGGLRVLWARLPHVIEQPNWKANIYDAILRTAFQGSTWTIEELRAAVGVPDEMFLDGLDECDPHRAEVTEAIDRWATGHSTTRIFVTTRPIGYSASLLPGWCHVVLLPLDDSDRRAHTLNVLTSAIDDQEVAARRLQDFERRLANTPTGPIAARNPLLLGFLIGLFLAERSFGESRVELYEQILELARLEQPRERAVRERSISGVLARGVLHFAGWQLLLDPGTPLQRLIEQSTSVISLERPKATDVEAAISYWAERRILEVLRISSRELLTFAHPGLGEFAAACHATSLPEHEQRSWVLEHYKEGRWREPIMMAAARRHSTGELILRTLLDAENPADPASTSILIAAGILSEMKLSSGDLFERVAAHLRARLESEIQELAFEAHEHLVPLARLAPQTVGELVKPLLASKNRRIRLTASHLAMLCKLNTFGWESIRSLIEEMITPPVESPTSIPLQRLFRRSGWSDVDLGIYSEFAERVLADPTDEKLSLLERVLFYDITTVAVFDELSLLIHRKAPPEFARRIEEREQARSPTLRSFAERQTEEAQQRRAADMAMLDAIIDAAGGIPDKLTPAPDYDELPNIALLLEPFDWGGEIVGVWGLLAARKLPESLCAVLEGTIAALGLDARQLVKEADWARRHIDLIYTRSERRIGYGLSEWLPKLPSNPVWKRANTLGLSADALIAALRHPTPPVRRVAAQLLAAGAGGSSAGPLLQRALDEKWERYFPWLGILAVEVLGQQAREPLMRRLSEPLSRSSAYLFRALPGLLAGEPVESVLPQLLSGLRSGDPEVVYQVAETLIEFPSIPSELFPELRGLLLHPLPRDEPAGDRSRRELSNPTPVVLKLLERVEPITREALLAYCADGRTRPTALELGRSRSEPTVDEINDILVRVRDGSLSVYALDYVLSLPTSTLRQVLQGIKALFDAADVDVREYMLKWLPKAEWLPRAEATALVRARLDDSDPALQWDAVLLLRQLQQKR